MVSGWASSQYPFNSGSKKIINFGPLQKEWWLFSHCYSVSLHGIAPQRKRWLTLCATLRHAQNASQNRELKNTTTPLIPFDFFKDQAIALLIYEESTSPIWRTVLSDLLTMLGKSDPKWRFHGDFPWYNPLENTPSTHPRESTCLNFNDGSWVQEFKDLDPKSIDFLWVFKWKTSIMGRTSQVLAYRIISHISLFSCM